MKLTYIARQRCLRHMNPARSQFAPQLILIPNRSAVKKIANCRMTFVFHEILFFTALTPSKLDA